MKLKLSDLQNIKFGRLRIVNEAKPLIYNKIKNRRFLCKCDCGNEKIIQLSSLRGGLTKSCGCLSSELTTLKNTRHNLSKHPLYKVWKTMKHRCLNPNAEHFARYGGRGISVCAEWLNDFQNFYNWAVANGYQKGLQLDRIDNDGDYEPNNCRFATRTENMRNCSQTKIDFKTAHEIRRKKKLFPQLTESEIASAYPISRSTVNQILLNKTWQ